MHYKNAIKNVTPDRGTIETMIDIAYKNNTVRHPAKKKMVALALAAALIVIACIPAAASKVITGSFIGLFVEIEGYEAVVENASVNIGEAQTVGNYKLTLDRVLTDNYCIYTKFILETLDGSALSTYADAATSFFGITASWRNPYRMDSYGGGTMARIDDGSNPAKAEIASIYTANDVGKRMLLDVNTLGFSRMESDFQDAPVADFDLQFTVKITKSLSAVQFRAEDENDNCQLEISPLGCAAKISNPGEKSAIFSNMQDVNPISDCKILFSDGSSAEGHLSSAGGTFAHVSFERVFEPENVVALQFNENIYPVIKK